MFKNYSIRIKLIVVLITISLLSMGTVTLVNSYIEQAILVEQANDALLAAASQTRVMLDIFIDNQLQTIRVTAKLPTLVNYLSSSPDQQLKNRSETNSNISTLCSNVQDALILSCALLDKNGLNLLDTYPLDIGTDESDHDYFQNAVKTGLPYVSTIEYANDKSVIYFSTPMRGVKGEIIGVLRMRYNAFKLQDIITTNNGLGGKDSFAILLDEHNIFLAHSLSPELISAPIEPLSPKLVMELQQTNRLPTAFTPQISRYSAELVAALKTINPENPFFTVPVMTKDEQFELISGAVIQLKNQTWSVIFVQPNEVFLAPIRTQIQTTLLVTAMVAMLVLGIALWLAYSLTSPIILLTQTIQQIDQGQLETHIRIDSNDEIGHLGQAFNNMTDRVRELITSLQSNNQQLAHEVDERVAAEEELQKANEELSTGNEELRAINEELQTVQEQLATTNHDLLKAKNQAELANQAKSDFLSNMSHELRTPLNGILGYAQILQRNQDLTPLQKDGLNIIRESGEHLLTLITDILDLSKVEAGKLDLYPTELNLSEFLEGVAGIIRIRAQQQGLGFALEDIPPLPRGVLADGKRLRQVLINLLNNAVKFTDKGSVTLRVRSMKYDMGYQEKPTVLLRFEVIDTGIGMAVGQLHKIFQPFEQVGELQRRSEGTGLGLAISRRLTELMGTQLYVESELNKGSRFWFEVLLPIIDVGTKQVAEIERMVIGYKGVPRRVLVVDDKLHNRMVFRNILEPLGFTVSEAEDGQASLEVVRQIKPDLILMDMIMPIMTGFEAVQTIRQMPELAGVVIFAATASVFEEDQQRVILAGCDAFLSKPVEMNKLLDLMETYLKLEWLYQKESEPIAVESSTLEPSTMMIPSPEAMKILLQLATRGDIPNVRKWANQVENMDSAYKAFANKVRELAKGYQSETIITLVKSYLA